MNAQILGLSREEIDARFDDIAAFADIGDFIERPIKTYSSGMMVRLAFAVQAQVDPDILIVDEALAVGDAKFQAKCFRRLEQLKRGGASILLVTHSAEQIVAYCERAILLERGLRCFEGEPKDATNRYKDLLFGSGRVQNQIPDQKFAEPSLGGDVRRMSATVDVFSTKPGYNASEYRWGDGAATILDFYLEASGDAYPSAVESGAQVRLEWAIRFHKDLERPITGLAIKTKDGLLLYDTNTELLQIRNVQSAGKSGTTLLAHVNFICRLAPGDYFISLGLSTENGTKPHDRRYDAIHLQVKPTMPPKFLGLIDLDLKFDTFVGYRKR
jgi:lipopolysaccharide transport system ATP-binding protein